MGVGTGVPLFLVCGLRVFMNAEFIAMLDYLERERGIKREILLEAVSNALLSASKKSVGASRDLRNPGACQPGGGRSGEQSAGRDRAFKSA
jgi:hypothetical protein